MASGESTPLVQQTGENGKVHWTKKTSRRVLAFTKSVSEFFTKAKAKAVSKQGVGAAAFLIRDAAMEADSENPAEGAFVPYADDTQLEWVNYISIMCHRLCSSRPLLGLLDFAGWMLIVLSFIEPPHWCRPTEDNPDQSCSSFLMATGPVAGGTENDDEAQLYPNAHSMLIDEAQSHIIEAVCISFILLFVLLRIGRDGGSIVRYFRAGSARMNRILQIVALGILVIGTLRQNSYYSPYARLLVVMSFNDFNFQKNVQDLIDVLPQVSQVLGLLGLVILFYGWFGAVMFVDTEGEETFSSLIESVWTLWICVTTANYPDVMMPAYNNNRWVALYFISFMGITFFFLMNLILAVIVNQYNETATERSKERKDFSEDCLKKAYNLLDPHDQGWIDKETVMATFDILNEDFPEFRTVSEEEKSLIYALLDQDGSNEISREEFMGFTNVLLLEFVRESDYSTWVQRNFPMFFKSEKYQAFAKLVKSTYFEYAVDFILILNAIVVAIQSYPELSSGKVHVDPHLLDGSIDTPWEIAETIFTSLYCLEIVAKVTVYGWRAYIENSRNVFDFTITMLAFISAVMVYYPNDFSDSRLIRMVVMIRVLRLVRLFAAVPAFQLIFQVSAKILPAARSIALLLFYVLYFYSALGVHLYGGMISRDTSNNLSYLLLNTDFSDNDYWANNFNDMTSGMNVLFNLLVVNNWTECEVGFEAVTQSRMVRFFFLSFHIVGVILVNNLVVAFVIDAFLDQLAYVRQKREAVVIGDGEAVLHGAEARFDASEVTGTKTSLSGAYRVRLRHTNSDASSKESDTLRELFTQKST